MHTYKQKSPREASTLKAVEGKGIGIGTGTGTEIGTKTGREGEIGAKIEPGQGVGVFVGVEQEIGATIGRFELEKGGKIRGTEGGGKGDKVRSIGLLMS